MCVYDEHLLAGQDIQYRAPDSRSRYTTPFGEIKSNVQHLNNPLIPIMVNTKFCLLISTKKKKCLKDSCELSVVHPT